MCVCILKRWTWWKYWVIGLFGKAEKSGDGNLRGFLSSQPVGGF